MEISDLYKCIADPQRLRILNLLEEGALCVCQLQEIVGVSQVKMSKQLAIMKHLGFLQSERKGIWMVYGLAPLPDGLLCANLDHLRAAQCAEGRQLRHDLVACRDLLARSGTGCPVPACRANTEHQTT